MELIEFLITYWYIAVAFLALGAAVGIAIYCFFKLPTKEQLEKVREWLLWAVTEAERELGGGTGQLKLRSVYDAFVARFGWLAKIIPFRVFSDLVDDALIEMRELLEKNENVAAYVEGPTDNTAKVGF